MVMQLEFVFMFSLILDWRHSSLIAGVLSIAVTYLSFLVRPLGLLEHVSPNLFTVFGVALDAIIQVNKESSHITMFKVFSFRDITHSTS